MLDQSSRASRFLYALIALIVAVGLGGGDRARADMTETNLAVVVRTVKGSVADAAGQFAVGANVRILHKIESVNGPSRRDPNRSPTGDSTAGDPSPDPLQKSPDRVFKQMRTDAQGRFVFTDVPVGSYIIAATYGKTAVRQPLDVKADADPDPIKLQLK